MAKKPHMVTLREASVAAGVSISALRKWYNAGLVASELVEGPNGEQRLVDLDAVRARAARIQEERAGTGVVAIPSEVWRSTVAAVSASASGPGELAALRTEMIELRADIARIAEVVLRNEQMLQRFTHLADRVEECEPA